MEVVRVVLYTRVSSEDQLQGLSLETQEQACRDYARRQGWEVARVFREEAESAKSLDRPQLEAMLDWARRSKPAVLLVYKLNRLARDQVGHFALRAHLRKLGISLRSATEPIDDTLTGELLEGVLSAVAQFDNRQRAQVCKAGMVEAAKRGRFCWRAPWGYRNVRREGGPTIELDADVAPVLREAFVRVANGAPQSEVLAWVRELGFKLDRTTMSDLLRNPAYCGRMVYPAWGVDTVGNWEPAIDVDTWRRAQVALLHRGILAGKPKRCDREEFPLRGLIHCSSCGGPLTAAWSRSKTGKRYGYYQCPKGACKVRWRHEAAHKAFVDLLEQVRPQPGLMALWRETVLDLWTRRGASAANEAEAHRRNLAALEGRKARLLDAYLDGVVSREAFAAKAGSLDDQIVIAQVALRELEADTLDVETVVAQAEHVLENAARLWVEADLARQRRLVGLLFTDPPVVLPGGSFRTPSTLSVFSLLGTIPEGVGSMVAHRPESSNPSAPAIEPMMPLLRSLSEWLAAA